MIALLLGLGVLEIAVWMLLAQFMSGWLVFFWFIVAFFIGLKLLRHSSRKLMPYMQDMQRAGSIHSLNGELRPAIAQLLAGILLVIPGVLSDVLALLLLIPLVQKRMVNAALNAFAKRQQKMMQRMMQQQGFASNSTGTAQNGFANNPMFAELLRKMQAQQQGRATGHAKDYEGDIIEGEAREIEPEAKMMTEHNAKQS